MTLLEDIRITPMEFLLFAPFAIMGLILIDIFFKKYPHVAVNPYFQGVLIGLFIVGLIGIWMIDYSRGYILIPIGLFIMILKSFVKSEDSKQR
jgi:hypothetical protein